MKFESFALIVQEYYEKDTQIDNVMYDDTPEDFLDPLMDTLMKDPVFLPTSGITCDRETILQHLLNDKFDPWTKRPLTVEMLEPATELKQKISDWLKEKMKDLKNWYKKQKKMIKMKIWIYYK